MNKILNHIRQWASEIAGGSGSAVHIRAGNRHAVAIASMRVIIVQDGLNTWFAQSLDIDYASNGSSIEDTQRNFETGLSSTIKAHLERFGNIDRIMKSPPLEDWIPLVSRNGDEFEFSMSEAHDFNDKILVENLPYRSISYIEPLRKAA